MVNEFESTLVRVVERLSQLKIDYMICGSVASSHYGESRTTHDIDVVVDLSARHLAPLMQAFGEGFSHRQTNERTLFHRMD